MPSSSGGGRHTGTSAHRHSPKVKQRHMAWQRQSKGRRDGETGICLFDTRTKLTPSEMKHPSATMRSAVIAASLVCLIPASVEADTTQTDIHPATSTNDFSATKGTDTPAKVDQRAKALDGGLNTYNNDAADMREDEEYWDRLLQTMEGSLPNAASEASSTEIQDEDECQSRVIDIQCPGCQPIEEDCVLEVDMTHIMINSGDATVRIYELNAIRNRGEVNLYDLLPSDAIDMQPGSQIQVVERVEINQCEGDTFETETQLIVGPPADVVVNIACLQENGGDCRSISQPETTEGCQEDVLYTYRVVNTGAVDANIITLERTRNVRFEICFLSWIATHLPLASWRLWRRRIVLISAPAMSTALSFLFSRCQRMTCCVKALPPTVIRINKTHVCRPMYVVQACVIKIR